MGSKAFRVFRALLLSPVTIFSGMRLVVTPSKLSSEDMTKKIQNRNFSLLLNWYLAQSFKMIGHGKIMTLSILNVVKAYGGAWLHNSTYSLPVR